MVDRLVHPYIDCGPASLLVIFLFFFLNIVTVQLSFFLHIYQSFSNVKASLYCGRIFKAI